MGSVGLFYNIGTKLGKYAEVWGEEKSGCPIIKSPLLHPDDQITRRTDDNLDVMWGL